MNHYTYAILALDIARERAAEAEQNYIASQLFAGAPHGSSVARRLAAEVVAAVSRGSAWAVRKLDDRVADELGRRLAPAE